MKEKKGTVPTKLSVSSVSFVPQSRKGKGRENEIGRSRQRQENKAKKKEVKKS